MELLYFRGFVFFFSSRRRHTRLTCDWSSDVCSSDLELVRAMSWDEFSATMEQAFRRDGNTVKRLSGGADFELVQGSRSTLVACKRWKAMRTGIEPLRELEDARRAREAAECIYVATGEVTAQARAFA